MQYPDGEAYSWHPPGAEGPHSSHEEGGEPETLGDSEEGLHNQTLHTHTHNDGWQGGGGGITLHTNREIKDTDS